MHSVEKKQGKESTEISGHPIEKVDIAAGKSLAKHRHTKLGTVADHLGKLSDQEPLYAVGAGLFFLSLSNRFSWLRPASFSILKRVAIADLSKRAVKSMVKRTRPHELLDNGRYELDVGGGERKEEQSFPSGHVACTVAAAIAVSRHYPRALPVVAAFAGLVGVARIIKGSHWPSDVLAGAMLGVASDLAATAVERVIAPKR